VQRDPRTVVPDGAGAVQGGEQRRRALEEGEADLPVAESALIAAGGPSAILRPAAITTTRSTASSASCR